MKYIRIIAIFVIYTLTFTLPIGALAAIGLHSTMRPTMPNPAALAIPETGLAAAHRKSYDPAKETVAIVLGSDRTEGSDFLIPDELFSTTGAYNVYAVAPERKITSLAGGLEVMPDFSYAELDKLLGRSPAVVVIPAFPNVASRQNKPVLTWIKQQSARGSYIFSICVGAEAFAATGLLDGRTATMHWGDIGRIEKAYPAVRWVRGVRYVDGGDYITSTGITSGIDAVLHYIAQHKGDGLARSVAQKMHYPSYAFVSQPRVQQESASVALTLVGLKYIVFHPNHPTAGVLLYDGVGELELASAYDTYGASCTTRLLSIAESRQLVTTRHGLQLVPRWGFGDVPAMDCLIVPGVEARQLAAAAIGDWKRNSKSAQVFYLHADNPDAFAFDAPLLDLARQENIPTAVLAAKRLEYRPGTLQTEGSRWPLLLTLYPLLVGSAGIAVTSVIRRHWRRRISTRYGVAPGLARA